MSVKDFALWSLLAWLWGSSFLAIDIGVEAIAPLPLAAIRMSVGAVALLAVLALRGGNLRLGLRGWLIALVLGGTGNAMPFVLIAYAETQVASGLAALIMGTAPLLTILLAPSVAREGSLTPMILFGGCLGFAGVAVLVGPDALLGGGGDLLPKVALLGAARVEPLGDAEVDHLGAPVRRDDDVGGLEVAVHQARLVGRGEPGGHLARDGRQGPRFCQQRRRKELLPGQAAGRPILLPLGVAHRGPGPGAAPQPGRYLHEHEAGVVLKLAD